MPKDSTHEQYMEASIKLLDTCDCVYVLKDWYGSAGVKEEIMYAKEHMIPVYFEDIEQTDKEQSLSDRRTGRWKNSGCGGTRLKNRRGKSTFHREG